MESRSCESSLTNNLHRRIEFRAATRQLDTVNARHLNIGEKQIEDLTLERGQRGVAILKRLHFMTGTAQRRSQKAAQGVIIFSK